MKKKYQYYSHTRISSTGSTAVKRERSKSSENELTQSKVIKEQETTKNLILLNFIKNASKIFSESQ